MKTREKNIIIGCLSAVLCEILYGTSYLFTKEATKLASAFALLGWRFLVASILMTILVILGIIKIDLRNKRIKPLLLVAFFCPCVYFILETTGIKHTTSSETGVFLACIPIMSLLASTFILKKKPTKFQITGILITLVGVIVTVFAVGLSASLSVIGYAFLLAAVISYSLYCVFVDKASEFSGVEITYIMLVAGAFLYTVLAISEALLQGNVRELVALPFEERAFGIAILYQGIGCSLLAFFLSNIAIAKIGVNRTSSFIGISTVTSIIAGVVFLHESFTIYQLIGAVIIIIGVYVANAKIKE